MTSLYIIHEKPYSNLPDENISTNRTETNTELKAARPPNAYILYRKAKREEITEFFKAAGQKNPFEKNLSILISQWWKQETDVTRLYYKCQADIEAAEFKKRNPWYKYQPIQKKKKNQKAVKQTHCITKKKNNPQKSLQSSTYNTQHTLSVDNNCEEYLLPTCLPSQCLSQDDLANDISIVDFHKLDINLCNAQITFDIDYQALDQFDDSFFDFCIPH